MDSAKKVVVFCGDTHPGTERYLDRMYDRFLGKDTKLGHMFYPNVHMSHIDAALTLDSLYGRLAGVVPVISTEVKDAYIDKAVSTLRHMVRETLPDGVPILLVAHHNPSRLLTRAAIATSRDRGGSLSFQLCGSFDASLGNLLCVRASAGTELESVRGVIAATKITPEIVDCLFSRTFS